MILEMSERLEARAKFWRNMTSQIADYARHWESMDAEEKSDAASTLDEAWNVRLMIYAETMPPRVVDSIIAEGDKALLAESEFVVQYMRRPDILASVAADWHG